MNWSQLRTILWLRWRLTRNQWSRGGQLNAVLTMIVFVIGLVVAVAGGFGGVLAGAFALAKARPTVMLVVWDLIVGLFLFLWLAGIVSEIQRAETIDISRLLHLPISLRNIFFVNYLASHLTFSIILFLPGMLGLSAGLILGGRGFMVLMFPLVLGFVFMITAWTYCLRGWLVALMMNKRRRRAIIAGVTFAFILLTQLPYILGQVFGGYRRQTPGTSRSVQPDRQTASPADRDKAALPHVLLVAHKVVPLLWVGNGAISLAQGNAWPAVLCAAGAFGIGTLGLRRAYRSTLRFYQGQATGKRSRRKPKVEKATATRKNFLDRELPGVPQQAAALALASFRYLTRAPEVKMALATNVIMLVIFGTMILVRRSAAVGEAFKPFIATGAVAVTFLGMSQLMFNHFGLDRAGFRTLALSPAPRKQILLGKNLAFLPIAVIVGLTFLVVARVAIGIPFVVLFAACLHLVAAFLLLSMAGNLLSVLVPYRIAPGSLKPTKTSATTGFLIFISRMLFPAAMIPIFLPPLLGLLLSKLGWFPAAPANLLLSAVMLLLILVFYRLSLAPLGELLQRWEKKILDVVTKEVE
jgi:ABC-2 type transport system permease protein